MKCNQCDRPGIYVYGEDKHLCLNCHSQVMELQMREREHNLKEALLNAALMNQAQDEIESFSPLGFRGNRIPVAAIAQASSRGDTTMNHISISGSNIGVLNAGDRAKIDAVVTITDGSDAEELGLAIKDLAQCVIDSNEIQENCKREVGELLAALTEQITGTRSKSVLTSLLDGIKSRVETANSVWTLAERVQSLVLALIS